MPIIRSGTRSWRGLRAGSGKNGPGEKDGSSGLATAVLAAVAAVTLCLAAPGVASAAAPPAGTVLAWGINDVGELGVGSSPLVSDVPVAARLPVGTTVTAVAAGDDDSLALTSAGTVLAWGENRDGELGDGSTVNRFTPVAVQLPAGVLVTAIAAGFSHSLALTSDGRVLAWGDNSVGQLGLGTASVTRSLTPQWADLPPGTRVIAISAGGNDSLALTSDGRVLAWGDNRFGQLGNGGVGNQSFAPVQVHVPAGVQVTAVSAGAVHGLALTSGGRVLAWGDNGQGDVGVGTTSTVNTPVFTHLPAGVYVTAINAGGGTYSLAVTCDGRVLGWGWNFYGQMGDGSTTNRLTPVWAHLPAGVRVTTVVGGDIHTLAVTVHGHVLSWGNGFAGQLGNGIRGQSSVPVWVHLPAGVRVTSVAAAAFHSLAVSG